ncbi:MAG: tRNA (adenosine(37)-N6)-threonylcarbamoyltransferase complex transferase subunit TsaD, partial [Oscillospiraceae bacterium]|nr:tRNA (adenosine(37)-N6)-threonylcarbamoyltransferase complex transferase subunit TsaD [Oscillospiraceae bacterium]
CARALGFPYPGGVHIDKASVLGDPETYKLPVPRVAGSEYDFSFSGLKTAVINMVHNASQKGTEINKNDMAASVQKTISEILVTKTILAAKDLGYKKIVLAGGVSANSGVRSTLTAACEKNGFELFMPPLSLCGDNGAMIACQGYYNYLAGITADVSLNAVATMSIEKI